MPIDRPAPVASGPLVSVGVPVRNGAGTLCAALDSVVGQTHRNLEIIISDNASDDGTADLCRDYAQRDSRIRYHRQPVPISGWDNFRFVFDRSAGDYFLWAAHDDRRDLNFVEVLLRAFPRVPTAALAFSDVVAMDPSQPPEKWKRIEHAFDTVQLTRGQALRRLYRRRKYYETYGLYRTECLRGYTWPQPGFGEDLLLLTWLLAQHSAVHEQGTRFYYSPRRQTRGEHVLRHALHVPSRFLDQRVVWAGAGLAVAERQGFSAWVQRVTRFADFYWNWHDRARRRSKLATWIRRRLGRNR